MWISHSNTRVRKNTIRPLKPCNQHCGSIRKMKQRFLNCRFVTTWQDAQKTAWCFSIISLTNTPTLFRHGTTWVTVTCAKACLKKQFKPTIFASPSTNIFLLPISTKRMPTYNWKCTTRRSIAMQKHSFTKIPQPLPIAISENVLKNWKCRKKPTKTF